ncbi:DUF3392 domain-containing protein [Shewanella violacea]|uniref:DUF3392 domain-containing protein n=1 Tax=Shewanella violacea (strain JCM 10179 / CIP 106290 / LMG 19151 / DSS12) TaxID=637905 RepID=D4ZFJ5_SHEVD|nr:DUF3392 domain-containing protein [Shewanella violacea]BAJ00444.1 conserved hypothetical protein [Shewanella violacea DSS12]
MEHIISVFHQVGSLLYPWLNEISTAIIACFLIVFAADFNRLISRKLTGRSFILRTLVFVFINAFGYGLLIVTASPFLAKQMAQVSAHWLLLLVISIFIFIGVWAQRNKQI